MHPNGICALWEKKKWAARHSSLSFLSTWTRMIRWKLFFVQNDKNYVWQRILSKQKKRERTWMGVIWSMVKKKKHLQQGDERCCLRGTYVSGKSKNERWNGFHKWLKPKITHERDVIKYRFCALWKCALHHFHVYKLHLDVFVISNYTIHLISTILHTDDSNIKINFPKIIIPC